MKEDESYKSIYTVQEALLIDEGLVERTPITSKDLKHKAENYTPEKNRDFKFSSVEPILDLSVFLSCISERVVIGDALERQGRILGEELLEQHQEGDGLGFFIDFDDLIPEISGVSGKSKQVLQLDT